MSPVRPENRARYPRDWHAIRERIMERAQNRCECRGECGLEHEPWGGLTGPDGVRRTGERVCRAPHARHILRDVDASAAWEQHEPGEDCDWRCEEGCLAVKVVLTVAHLDHTPENNDPTNLRAFCQFCHNRYDREHRNATAASTRHRRRAVADLFAEATDDA